MTNVTVFRPKSNYAFAAAALLLDATFVAQTLFYPAGENVALSLLTAGAIAAGTALLWLRPKLVLGETEIKVVNPLRTVSIAYRDITDLQTKWSLLIVHRSGKVRVWVAPASGRVRYAARRIEDFQRDDRVASTALVGAGSEPVSQSVQSDSGLAAALIRNRMHELGIH